MTYPKWPFTRLTQAQVAKLLRELKKQERAQAQPALI